MHRNTRWCSDGFEIPCDNREVISYVATTRDILGSMVRDLMLESVERRFGNAHTSHTVEWLSDNGSCYTAKETVEFASWIGLRSCFTPVRSPESNGMAEAFVKTFKRDYVARNICSDAPTVLKHLSEWFEDYNENAPHKGLRLRSPRQFIRLSATAGCPV